MPNKYEEIGAIANEVFGGDAPEDAGGSMQDPVAETRQRDPGVAQPQQREPEDRNEAAGQDYQDDPEGESQDDGQVVEPHEITSFGDLVRELEAAGWDPQDVYGLEMVLDDGAEGREPTRVPLGEIKDRLQANQRAAADIEKERSQLQEQVNAFMYRARQYAEAQQTITEAEQHAQNQMLQVQAAFNAEDWNSMSPGDRAARENEYSRIYADAKKQFEQVQQQANQFREQSLNSLKQQHHAKLLEVFPEWKDQQVAMREGQATGMYMMQNYGFQPEEISSMYDWRHRAAYAKARLWDEHLRKVKDGTTAAKRQTTRTMPPGKGGTRRQLTRARAEQLAQRARQTRTRSDRLAAGLAVLEESGVKLG